MLMPWIIGIDEAGYGPNLGPFVMTSVAFRVPTRLVNADLWQVLGKVVCREPNRDDRRLLVADSKIVYSPTQGLRALEHGVLACLASTWCEAEKTVKRFLDWLCPVPYPEWHREPWFEGNGSVPLTSCPADLEGTAQQLVQCLRKHRIELGLVRASIICPSHFNGLLERWGSKGAILSEALVELVDANLRIADPDRSLHFVVDKHGGRNRYAAVLQNVFPTGVVSAQQECMDRSSYRVVGLDQDVQLTFQPRADADNFCVALASMVSKYVRELMMAEFNRFWQAQVQDLKPTAGYPGDAARYYEQIRPVAASLGLAEESLWRRK
jgi:hypothetical protein